MDRIERKLVFLSHSSKDSGAAENIARQIEELGIPCWIAPRDVPFGENFGASVIEAIEHTEVFVVLLSGNANNSIHVANEIERAVNYRKTIIPLRLEDVRPSKAFDLHISARQWVDLFEGEQQREQKMRRFLDVLRDALRSWLVPDLPRLTEHVRSSPQSVEPLVRAAAQPELSEGEFLAFGENRLVRKEMNKPNNRFYFRASENDVIFARNTSAPYCDLVIELFDERGSTLTTSAGKGEARIHGELLDSSGLYSVAFGTSLKGVGAELSIFLQRTNNPERAKTVRYGKNTSGSVNATGAVNTYSLDFREGESVRVEVEKVSADVLYPRLDFYDADGFLLDSGHGNEKQCAIEHRVGASGRYTLLVSCMPEKTGAYSMLVERSS